MCQFAYTNCPTCHIDWAYFDFCPRATTAGGCPIQQDVDPAPRICDDCVLRTSDNDNANANENVRPAAEELKREVPWWHGVYALMEETTVKAVGKWVRSGGRVNGEKGEKEKEKEKGEGKGNGKGGEGEEKE